MRYELATKIRMYVESDYVESHPDCDIDLLESFHFCPDDLWLMFETDDGAIVYDYESTGIYRARYYRDERGHGHYNEVFFSGGNKEDVLLALESMSVRDLIGAKLAVI